MFADPTKPNQADYTAFIRATMGIGTQFLPDDSDWIGSTLSIAQALVNKALACASAQVYVLAVYNLAGDRLINYAQDVPDQTYFQDLRKTMRIGQISVGVPSSVSDQGTSDGILNPDFMQHLTLQDLQTLKTPYGRQYMAFAQAYGSTLWGIS